MIGKIAVSLLSLFLAFIRLLVPLMRLRFRFLTGESQVNLENSPMNATFLLKRATSAEVAASLISSVHSPGGHLAGFLDNLEELHELEKLELILVLVKLEHFEVAQISNWANSLPNVTLIETRTLVSIYEAWNLAIMNARGELITNINVDDKRFPSSVLRQIDYMNKHPTVMVAASNYLELSNGQLRFVNARDQTLSRLVFLRENPPHAAPIWRASLHRDFGYFNVNFGSSGDTDFWLRLLLREVRFGSIPGDPLYIYSKNPEGKSTSRLSQGQVEWAKSLEKNSFLIAKQLLKKISHVAVRALAK